ncbi:unnamed protein product [Brassicogethes aeneus]|uniref:CCHC-type domain-containing protein n=1 Tax=Brassicogethes aeneus TaxID=1431903 RepID=A0A9P0FEV9_BRAAE|nr:unnamed protein product [Brassicogethes aeneus]
MGLTPASARPRVNIEKCHKCWEPGHIASRCAGTDRSKCCLKCGKTGHTVDKCTEEPYCPLCEQPHRAWSGKCDRMRTLLASTKSAFLTKKILEYNEDVPSTSKETQCTQGQGPNRTELKKFARVLDRYGVSDRSAAAIASAVLKDVGIITEGDTVNVVDRSKVRRARIKSRQSLQDKGIDNSVKAVFFDGRKD